MLPEREDIRELNENLTAFPTAESIFVKEQAWLKDHFLPLISIDLAEVNPEWKETKVHMICPFEPYEGLIGEQTTDFHNEFTAINWLAFRLTADNQYEFLGNERFFLRSPIHEQNWDEEEQNWDEEEQKHFDEMAEIYAESKAQVERDGFLIFPRSQPFQGKPNITTFLDQMGGEIWAGNWINDPAPSAFECYEDDECNAHISHNGNPFYHIASVAGYNYCGHGADAIVLLYEPISRIVLFTFDFT